MDKQLSERMSLGASELRVSPLGVGTNSWGPKGRADRDQRATFEAALENGVNFFDTAEIYNSGGSERTLGLFLNESRPKVSLATKFFPLPWRLGPSAMTRAIHASLERLQIPQVDLYMLHFPLPPVPFETWIRSLADVKEAGLTRAVGISNCNTSRLRKAHAVLSARGIPLASDQVEFSLLKKDAEQNGLLAACQELNVTLVAYRPLGYGLLSGKYTPDNPPAWLHGKRYNRAYMQRISALLALQQEIAKGHSKTPAQVALNWILCKGAIPIPGAKNPRQAAENAGALGWRLAADEVEALDKASSLLI